MVQLDARHDVSSLEKKLQSLYGLRGGPTIDLTIRPPYRKLLKRLGNPHRQCPPIIHVAGTNGKGSTIAFMRAICEAAGYKVHVLTSPHLIKFNERIVLAGEMISDRKLEDLIDEVMEINGDLPQTFFEFTTAVSFLAFSRTEADILLLETGLGGRLDCTNVIENPAACVITNIGFDHMEFLGDTVQQIAAEKAGIIKKGSPCVIAPQRGAMTHQFIKNAANTEKQYIIAHNDTWHIESGPGHFSVTHNDKDITVPHPTMAGAHQINNAASAVMALLVQDELVIPERCFKDGIIKARWPGRLAPLPPNNGYIKKYKNDIWLDGGHNEDAGIILAEQIALWQQEGIRTKLILGMMKRKNVIAFLKPMMPFIDKIYVSPIEGEDVHTASDLKELASEHNISVTDAASLDEAVAAAAPNTDIKERILITGSLYLAGEVLAKS